jgi:hypothetical protein
VHSCINKERHIFLSPFQIQVFDIQQDSRCKYKSNTEACSRNCCGSGKGISITYSEFVFVALGFLPAKRMRHIFVCGLFGSTIIFNIVS